MGIKPYVKAPLLIKRRIKPSKRGKTGPKASTTTSQIILIVSVRRYKLDKKKRGDSRKFNKRIGVTRL